MSQVTPFSPGSNVSIIERGQTQSWSNASNVLVAQMEGTTANSITPPGGGAYITRALQVRTYGFNLRSTAIIHGIELEIRRHQTTVSPSRAVDHAVRLLKGTTLVGNDLASSAQWPSNMATATYGGPTNTWGTSWSPSDIENIRCELQVDCPHNITAAVAFMRIRVYYSVPDPPTPTGLSGTVTSSSQITWGWNASNDADNYQINWRRSGTANWSTATVTSTSHGVSGLDAGTTYQARVRACHPFGCSDWSSIQSAITRPAIPTGLSGNGVNARTIQWNWSGTTGASQYTLRWRRQGLSSWNTVNVTGTSTQVAGLEATTTYEAQVRACNTSGCSSYSSTQTAATTEANPPNPPGNFSATALSHQSVRWSWSSQAEFVDYYVVNWRKVGEPAWEIEDEVIGLNFTASGLTTVTDYEARVRACNEAGCSDWTNIATIQTMPPPTPTGFATSLIDHHQVDASWNASAQAETYEIQYSRNENLSNGTHVTGLLTTAHTIQQLHSQTTYYIRVRACASGQCSAWSDSDEQTTLQNPTPENLDVNVINDTTIELTWDNIDGIDYFVVQRRRLN